MTPVPAGHIATVVTSLAMHAPPPVTEPSKSALRFAPWPSPVDRTGYLSLFRHVGAPWLWRGRLILDAAALAAVLDAPTTSIHVATRRDGTPVGLLDLDFSADQMCEIVYFGLIPGMTGNGHGRWLMAHALRLAWREGVKRVWLHTCDLDHPSALRFYQHCGFIAFQRAVEVYPDPRLAGLYDRDVAPSVLLL
jgi:GNAT superfamily N-acetyltransferase